MGLAPIAVGERGPAAGEKAVGPSLAAPSSVNRPMVGRGAPDIQKSVDAGAPRPARAADCRARHPADEQTAALQ